jgi:hypothetical protein
MRSQMILVIASMDTERIAPGIAPHPEPRDHDEDGLRVNRLARSIDDEVVLRDQGTRRDPVSGLCLNVDPFGGFRHYKIGGFGAG